jgi:hypothetical protein
MSWNLNAAFPSHAHDCSILRLEFGRFSGSDIALH